MATIQKSANDRIVIDLVDIPISYEDVEDARNNVATNFMWRYFSTHAELPIGDFATKAIQDYENIGYTFVNQISSDTQITDEIIPTLSDVLLFGTGIVVTAESIVVDLLESPFIYSTLETRIDELLPILVEVLLSSGELEDRLDSLGVIVDGVVAGIYSDTRIDDELLIVLDELLLSMGQIFPSDTFLLDISEDQSIYNTLATRRDDFYQDVSDRVVSILSDLFREDDLVVGISDGLLNSGFLSPADDTSTDISDVLLGITGELQLTDILLLDAFLDYISITAPLTLTDTALATLLENVDIYSAFLLTDSVVATLAENISIHGDIVSSDELIASIISTIDIYSELFSNDFVIAKILERIYITFIFTLNDVIRPNVVESMSVYSDVTPADILSISLLEDALIKYILNLSDAMDITLVDAIKQILLKIHTGDAVIMDFIDQISFDTSDISVQEVIVLDLLDMLYKDSDSIIQWTPEDQLLDISIRDEVDMDIIAYMGELTDGNYAIDYVITAEPDVRNLVFTVLEDRVNIKGKVVDNFPWESIQYSDISVPNTLTTHEVDWAIEIPEGKSKPFEMLTDPDLPEFEEHHFNIECRFEGQQFNKDYTIRLNNNVQDKTDILEYVVAYHYPTLPGLE